MGPKLECLNINCPADEVAEYFDRFNFWIDTRGTSDEKTIKGEFVVRIQQQASKCNFQEHLDVALRDRLVAGINRPELQRKLLSEKDTSFQNLRVVCETTEDLNNSTQEPAVLLH